MNLVIIAAISRNGVIGRDGKIPWRISEDMKRFKALTTGHMLVMGRKTFESIGKPLPGRLSIVMSQREFILPDEKRSPLLKTADHVAQSFAVALNVAVTYSRSPGQWNGKDLFVIGGEAPYRDALPRADRLELTRVDADFDGDARFPEWNESDFCMITEERREATEAVPYAHRFQTWGRINRGSP